MTDFKMLEEFVHYCSKCKMDLNHRVTLMNGSIPARVLCLTCNSERVYKDPAKKLAASLKAKAPTSSKLKSQVRQNLQQNEWQAKLRAGEMTPKKYSIVGSFATDDQVFHDKFGRGLVIDLEHPDKVHIFFESEGVKILKGSLAR